MRFGHRRAGMAAKVPAVFAALVSRGAFGSSCWAETCHGHTSGADGPDARTGSLSAGAASLLQHHHRRSHTPVSVPPDSDAGSSEQTFPDVPDFGCHIGSSCTSGGIPQSRGACVSPGGRSNECWDICNRDHLPEDFTTGDPEYEAQLARAVSSVRAGDYPHMRCPAVASQENSEAPSASEAAHARDINEVMDSISEAEKAADRARLLTSAAKRESAALGNTASDEVAEVMRLAAVAEAEAAEKAQKASKELKELSESRKLQADADKAATEAKSEEAEKKEEEAAVKSAEQAESEVVGPAQTADVTEQPSAEEAASSEKVDEATTIVTGNISDVSGGCCFHFGFGAMMVPCCMTTEEVSDRSLCIKPGDEMIGGKTGFTLQSCPATAAEAEKLLRDEEEAEAVMSQVPTYALGNPAESLEELQQKVDDHLVEAKRDVDLAQGVADSKLAVEKEKKAAAATARKSAQKEHKKTEVHHPEDAAFGVDNSNDGADPSAPSAAAEKTKLEAKNATREAKEAVLKAKEAMLVLKKDLQLKKLVECKVLAGTTATIKKDVKVFEDAIKEAKVASQAAMRELVMNLSASAVVRMKEAQDSEQAEIASRKALESAQAQTAAAQAAVEEARKVALKAELGEDAEDVNTTSSSDSTASGANSSLEDIIEKVIVKAGSHQELDNWGHGVSKAAEAQAEAQKNGQNNSAVVERSCVWKPDPKCAAKFRYQGEMHTGCNEKELDSASKAWCSLDIVYVGRWKTCTMVCEDGVGANGTEQS